MDAAQSQSSPLARNAPGDFRRSAFWMSRFLVPSISDWVFVSILGWLFFGIAGASALLGDGDTGWHIRTGEYILATGNFPHEDLFSFTMQGERWFAWEWLADVLFALAHKAGLAGVALLGGVVIAATAALLLRYMLWLRANILAALLLTLAAMSASSLHWHARPHSFTWILFLAALWLLEADRRSPSRQVYWLVPLTAVWVNLHGGWVAVIITLGIYLAGVSIEQLWSANRERLTNPRLFSPPAAKRYGLLLLLCLAASLANPYGWELHRHIAGYLQSDFILTYVQEFQAPAFRSESQRMFEGLLLLSVAMTALLVKRGEFAAALLLLAWAHASLTSVRHVPLFAIVAAPLLARQMTEWIERGAAAGNSWLRGIEDLAADYGGQRAARTEGPWGVSWLCLAGVAVVAVMLEVRAESPRWQASFPEVRFPAKACDSLKDRLAGARVLSTDQWSDYLIYRFYPEVKVFIDGRSDFYDPQVRDDYLRLMGADWRWPRIVDRYGFEAALLPLDWALTGVLKVHPDWKVVYDDGLAVYLERVSNADAALAKPFSRRRPGVFEGGARAEPKVNIGCVLESSQGSLSTHAGRSRNSWRISRIWPMVYSVKQRCLVEGGIPNESFLPEGDMTYTRGRSGETRLCGRRARWLKEPRRRRG